MIKYQTILLFLAVPFTGLIAQFSPTEWNYIEIENNRDKWGDYEDEPQWLRYFGLDMQDINGDGYAEILAGRRVYINDGGSMEDKWRISDLGINVDGIFLTDVDGDKYPDVIAQSLPNIYWLEAEDRKCNSWKSTIVAKVPKTSHVNSQGFEKAQIFKGGKDELIIAGNGNIYAIEIPKNKAHQGNWPTLKIGVNSSDEGIGYGDINGDGYIDITAGRRAEGNPEPTILVWWKNPGVRTENWESFEIGNSNHPIDRVEVADLNGDSKMDVIVAEERWPGKEPDGNLFWFQQPNNSNEKWQRNHVVTQYSMNNLDVSDLDRDGDQDLITCEHKGPRLELQIWQNDGKGNFTKNIIDQGKESHLGTQLFDMDSDGDLDVVSIGWDNYEFLHLWRNDSHLQKKAGLFISQSIKDTILFDRPHFVITSKTATYLYDKSGGGFSSILDNDGIDWVSYNLSGEDKYPESAAGRFRGVPNFVFGSEDGGAGHPGFDKCVSEKISDSEILTKSLSGNWHWRWKFTEQCAKATIEKVDSTHSYWFLYEGTPGGKYSPQTSYWGTSKSGPRFDTPDFQSGSQVYDHWDWAYFGENTVDRVLFVSMKPDKLLDTFSYLGAGKEKLGSKDGMVVFGFGRGKKSNSLMTKSNEFIIGFYETKVDTPNAYDRFERFMSESIIK